MSQFFRNLLPSVRLAICTIVGFAVFLALPGDVQLAMRATIGWIAGVVVFLGAMLIVIGHATPETMQRHARQQDSKDWLILALVVVAAAVSLASLAFVLQKTGSGIGESLGARISVAGVTLVVSWIFVHTTFAIHYAHYFYGDPDRDPATEGLRRGLAFPGTENPDFDDFLYYAFVVGMTCQVSDVQVTSRQMRRLTLLHGVLSFFFNAGVLALAVNILAAAI